MSLVYVDHGVLAFFAGSRAFVVHQRQAGGGDDGESQNSVVWKDEFQRESVLDISGKESGFAAPTFCHAAGDRELGEFVVAVASDKKLHVWWRGREGSALPRWLAPFALRTRVPRVDKVGIFFRKSHFR